MSPLSVDGMRIYVFVGVWSTICGLISNKLIYVFVEMSTMICGSLINDKLIYACVEVWRSMMVSYHHTPHLFGGFILDLDEQWKASENAGILESVPITLKIK